ncbi:winged helix-turn-helix transcriptional regulator [Microbacterium salsuginis]|uniref:winged helix-turn-helix transcriptional regulator n=1 Tax=Microbacterium salsuginis TaxID=2722803 RepID=UPI00197C6ADA|nr:helix-turn-helix domain-containing protein [Microbacterium sp. CFH 90308]
MPDYGRYCPVAIASEVVADRWTPLILREMILGNVRFNDIARGMPGVSRSLLVSRLRHLERKGVVETWPSASGKGSEYHLTPAGRDLAPIIESLGKWAVTWFLDDIHIHEIDPITLTWWMHRRTQPDRFPPHRTVIEFRHTAPKKQTIWLVLEHAAAIGMHHAPRLRHRRHRVVDDSGAGGGLQRVHPLDARRRFRSDRDLRAAPACEGFSHVVPLESFRRIDPSPARPRVGASGSEGLHAVHRC